MSQFLAVVVSEKAKAREAVLPVTEPMSTYTAHIILIDRCDLEFPVEINCGLTVVTGIDAADDGNGLSSGHLVRENIKIKTCLP